MLRDKLTDSEVAGIVRRAQELETWTDEALLANPEAKAALDAMQESGISKESALLALRERLNSAPSTRLNMEVGDLVFAAPGDGWYYPAKIESKDAMEVKVRYMSGAEGYVTPENIKRFDAHPGFKLHTMYSGMWCEAEVVTYNAHAQTLQMSYWGSNLTAGMDAIKIKDSRHQPPLESQLTYWAERAAYALAGSVVTFVLMKILTR